MLLDIEQQVQTACMHRCCFSYEIAFGAAAHHLSSVFAFSVLVPPPSAPALTTCALVFSALQFAKHDIDGSGCLERQELFVAISDLGVKLGHVQQDALWLHVDADGNGQVNYHEFLWMCNANQAQLMRKWRLLNKSLTRQQMLLHFDQFDIYHRGGLDCPQFIRALKAMIPDVIISEKDSSKLFKHFDRSGDGLLQVGHP
jgi:Ca2+-binding EF-hand superfamily protein